MDNVTVQIAQLIDPLLQSGLHHYCVGGGLFLFVLLELFLDGKKNTPQQSLIQMGMGLTFSILLFGIILSIYALKTISLNRIGPSTVYLLPTSALLLVMVHCYWGLFKNSGSGQGRWKLSALIWGLCIWAIAFIAMEMGYVIVGILLLCVVPIGLLAHRHSSISLDISRFLQGTLVVLFAVLAIGAAGNYVSWGHLRYGSFYNAYEFYHYYIGSKYAPEVGYMGMYEASLIADKETQPATQPGKEMPPRFKNSKGGPRNLATGIHYKNNQEVLDQEEQIKGWFSEERWEEFLTDIGFFKRELVDSRWSGILRDKGYNATPVWNALVGGLISNTIPTTNEGLHKSLSFLDVGLIAIAMGLVVWAFGLRTAFILIILLGTSYVMKYSHMKGAYLRTDFTMSLVMAICFMKKDHYKTAGALVAYSICSRVFPAIFLFGLGAKFLWDLLRIAPLAWKDQPGFKRLSILSGITLLCATLLATVTGALSVFQEVPSAALLFKIGLAMLVATALLWLAVLGLWGLYTRSLKPQYPTFFVSVLVTLLLLFGASIFYAMNTGSLEQYTAKQEQVRVAQLQELAGFEQRVGQGQTLIERHQKRMDWLTAATQVELNEDHLKRHFPFRFWEEYAQKIGKHNSDISPWRVGFKYIFVTEWGTRTVPSGRLKPVQWSNPIEALQTTFANYKTEVKINPPRTRSVIYNEKKVLWWSIIGSMLFISVFLVKGLKDHEALAWGFVPVFFLVAPTYYYYIMLLIPMLFFAPYIDRPARAIGCIMLLAMAMPGYYLYANMGWKQQYPTYYYHSVFYLILVAYMALVAGGATLQSFRAKPDNS